jgi:hypothetical protein
LFFNITVLIVCALYSTATLALAQEAQTAGKSAQREHWGEKFFQDLFAYLNMSDAKSAKFRPLTQGNGILFSVNRLSIRSGTRRADFGGQNQWRVPEPWEQGIGATASASRIWGNTRFAGP